MLAVPSSFGAEQRYAAKAAATVAGFKRGASLLNLGTAAAVSYQRAAVARGQGGKSLVALLVVGELCTEMCVASIDCHNYIRP